VDVNTGEGNGPATPLTVKEWSWLHDDGAGAYRWAKCPDLSGMSSAAPWVSSRTCSDEG
jgi:hypothetical protein